MAKPHNLQHEKKVGGKYRLPLNIKKKVGVNTASPSTLKEGGREIPPPLELKKKVGGEYRRPLNIKKRWVGVTASPLNL